MKGFKEMEAKCLEACKQDLGLDGFGAEFF